MTASIQTLIKLIDDDYFHWTSRCLTWRNGLQMSLTITDWPIILVLSQTKLNLVHYEQQKTHENKDCT